MVEEPRKGTEVYLFAAEMDFITQQCSGLVEEKQRLVNLYF